MKGQPFQTAVRNIKSLGNGRFIFAGRVVGIFNLHPDALLVKICTFIRMYTVKSTIMKRVIFIIAAFLLAAPGLRAQKVNDIKTDLFSAFLRTGALKYERAFTEDISAQLGFFYTGYHPSGADATLDGFGITPEFRLYLSESPAPDGIYIAPNVRYMALTVKATDSNEQAKLTVFGFAFNIGIQKLLKDIVVLDAWLGPSYNFRSIEQNTIADVGIPDANGFGIRVGVAVGIAF